MLEWLKRHAWKACIRQKRIASSNLAHSANKTLKINDLNVDFQGLFLRLLVTFRFSYYYKIGVSGFFWWAEVMSEHSVIFAK